MGFGIHRNLGTSINLLTIVALLWNLNSLECERPEEDESNSDTYARVARQGDQADATLQKGKKASLAKKSDRFSLIRGESDDWMQDRDKRDHSVQSDISEAFYQNSDTVRPKLMNQPKEVMEEQLRETQRKGVLAFVSDNPKHHRGVDIGDTASTNQTDFLKEMMETIKGPAETAAKSDRAVQISRSSKGTDSKKSEDVTDVGKAESSDTEDVEKAKSSDNIGKDSEDALSHSEQQMQQGKSENHFKRFLDEKHRLDNAVKFWKKGIGEVKHKAHAINDGLEDSAHAIRKIQHELQGVDTEFGALGHEVQHETQKASISSVKVFNDYNKDGLYSSAEAPDGSTEKMVHRVGTWDIFENMMKMAEEKSIAQDQEDNEVSLR